MPQLSVAMDGTPADDAMRLKLLEAENAPLNRLVMAHPLDIKTLKHANSHI